MSNSHTAANEKIKKTGGSDKEKKTAEQPQNLTSPDQLQATDTQSEFNHDALRAKE